LPDVLNDLLLELPFAASKKGLGIVGKCETASCKLAISDYTVLFASIMDIAQYCVYIGDSFFHRSIMERKKFLCKHEFGFLKTDGALISSIFTSLAILLLQPFCHLRVARQRRSCFRGSQS